jgi:hypothetical protein
LLALRNFSTNFLFTARLGSARLPSFSISTKKQKRKKTFKLQNFLFFRVSDVENSVHSRPALYSFRRQSRGESQDCCRLLLGEENREKGKIKARES